MKPGTHTTGTPPTRPPGTGIVPVLINGQWVNVQLGDGTPAQAGIPTFDEKLKEHCDRVAGRARVMQGEATPEEVKARRDSFRLVHGQGEAACE